MVISSAVIYLAVTAGGLTSLGVIWTKGIKPVIDVIKRIHEELDTFHGMDGRISEIEKNSRQLTNNGGSHMKDAVDRIERDLGDHLKQSARVDAETKQEFLNIYKAIALNSNTPVVSVGVEQR